MRCFRTRGKKGTPHRDPEDPPRRRANKRRGHGTYENDHVPVLGTVGRQSGQVRLRVAHHTDGATLCPHVEGLTRQAAQVYTDEWKGYNQVDRARSTVCHSAGEWARDDDGDGIREVHVNTIEGLWTSVRNFLRPFRGVHKKYLSGYIALCECAINHKRVTPRFIAALVAKHQFYT